MFYMYPSDVACVRQTDAWCRPGGSPVGTLCAPAGLVRRVGSGGSGGGGGGGRTGVQSGEGGHSRDLKKTTRGNTYKDGSTVRTGQSDNFTMKITQCRTTHTEVREGGAKW